MSFFFSKSKVKQQPRQARVPTPGKASRETLQRLGCSACPLNKADVSTPKMQPTLAVKTEVYFLAEYPGKHEDEESGKPLTGPSGKLLRECIPQGREDSCSFDNVVRDRPENNRTPVWNEIECCRQHIVKSIEEAKPRLIVGLGVIPLHWMLQSTDVAGMRGRVFAVQIGKHACWFMPTYHPSFILRVAFKKDKPLQSKMGHCFKMDIRRAFEKVRGLPKATVDTPEQARADVQCFNGSGADHHRAVLRLISEARKAPEKAIDLETSCLRPYATIAKILTVAISFANTNFSFALDHPKAGWTQRQKMEILAELELLLTDDTIKIAHNATFEIEWLISYFEKEVVNHAAWECTQMQAHFLDERRGKQARGGAENHRTAYQSLDFLVKQYFGIAYKSLFKLNKKDMSSADLDQTLIYNGVDTKYTLKLHKHQTELLIANDLYDAYLEALPRQPTVAIMQHLGIAMDQVEVKRVQKKLEGEIKEITSQINNLKVVKAYIKDKGEFNPMGQDALIVFRDYLHCKEVLIENKVHEIHTFDVSSKTKKYRDKVMTPDRYSVDKNVLDKIDHPLAQLIVDLRNRSKLKSTYSDPFELGKGEFIFPDNKIHPSFNTTFAETGRTSSDSPNQQNWSKRNDEWVRKQVVASPGHVLLAFDYGQLEGCTTAMCTKDKVMIKALWEDYDFHMDWAIKIADKYPEIIGGRANMADKAVMKKMRSKAKNKFVFPAIFGAKNSSIAGYLDMPEDKIDDLMDEFWYTFSETKNWQDQLTKKYYNEGWVESPTGRRHRYPLTRNQVINFPIQSVACDIVCDAMNRISYQAAQSGKWYMHPIMNIHDDLSFDIPDDDQIIEEAISEIYKTMLTPPYKFVNVPISVECSMGKNWFSYDEKINPEGMRHIEKFYSHKDL